uniref:acylphosphatase-2-like isoform X1 n=1 Tax=Doryrhamphus excisus TaxID=161450 RepID=UPI0025AE55D7|nr:acylphosphatase-2-like isoform X1 [Doryrhamphus excisus]XP_057921134.1 acylphosphatase-2-like isoform X1 [Doryrhamphus excisus]XP_057921135.1 acylphosphatase-2-like isoform X1 [Doryrhamphus excisus]XP_057921136.1 acylphosphatase-2-like isoform X1 [Doryrhamphus excisus]XP_057921137.1 acylphosphatase-2-like isoform X1 [Doryrhamphus excisus]
MSAENLWTPGLTSPVNMSTGSGLVSVDFEVFGHVQGVCFRMYTEKEAERLGVVGWVKNTRSGTVVGQVQGPSDVVEEMKVWLSKEGSPSSRISRTSFSNQRSIHRFRKATSRPATRCRVCLRLAWLAAGSSRKDSAATAATAEWR